ncbi:MAG: hypothetical protein ACHQYP_04520 [Nitrospiria bacterium]
MAFGDCEDVTGGYSTAGADLQTGGVVVTTEHDDLARSLSYMGCGPGT